MFTFIELKNFKSFGEIKFDFKIDKTNAKKFVAIYGENGSGKSNFVSSIELLSEMMTSYINLEQIQKIKKMLDDDHVDLDNFPKSILNRISFYDLQNKLKHCRTIDCNEPTKVTYGFIINGIEGYYSVSFDDESIIEEELYYLTNKQRGQLFKISKSNNDLDLKFSSYLFKFNGYKEHVCELINMFWGKHTLLALLLGEFKSKNKEYIYETVSQNCIDVIDSFMSVFILCKSSKNETTVISGSDIKISDFESVSLNIDDKKGKKQLEIVEKIINDFFTQAYTDILKVYYKAYSNQKNDSNTVEYKLFVKKIISGKQRIIPFSLESAGTQRVLFVLRAIIEAINGKTVVYDEIDDGIHDLLMKNILISVQKYITGQLIITTHNTLLLENLSPKSAYVICVDDAGYKEARCLDNYGIRIQSNNNQRKLYLNGVFGGIPYSSEIDYGSMYINKLKEK